MEQKEALAPDFQPRPYAMSENYDKGDVIEHSTFGLGFVLAAPGSQKMTVMFEKDLKTLAMNR